MLSRSRTIRWLRVSILMLSLLFVACAPLTNDQITPLATPFLIASPSLPSTPPTLTPPPVTAAPTVAPENCVYDSEYVSDVTIPDGTPVKPGETFFKTWRMVNSGTCPWNETFAMVQIGGDLLVATPQATPLLVVQPGEEVNISVSLQLSFDAPIGSEQTAAFQMRDGQGNFFGAHPFVIISVSSESGLDDLPTPTPLSEGGSSGGQGGGGQAGTISGMVFVDFCSISSGSPSANCVDNGQGGSQGNSLLDDGEEGIADVNVRLRPGACPGDPTIFSTAVTNENGLYSFGNLPAGPRCVEINALDPTENQGILVPGFWTLPTDVVGSTAQISISLGENEARNGVNFGWDYQLD